MRFTDNSHSQSRWQTPSFGDSYGFYYTRQKQTNRTIGQKRQPWLIMILISLILLGGIGSRLVYLQLLKGEVYREKAENNRIRIIPKPPVRGNIFDRKGRILASTRLTHASYLWPIVIRESNWEKNLR